MSNTIHDTKSSKYNRLINDMRTKLQSVLNDKHKFLKSARKSFNQFDTENKGVLVFDDIKALIQRLIHNLCLPPINDEALLMIVQKFSTDNNCKLDEVQFSLMFWQILWKVKEKYYPSKPVTIERQNFIGIKALGVGQINRLFKFVKKLGHGSFGEVHLVIEKVCNIQRCCKIINKERVTLPANQIEAEVNTLKALDHPNVIKILDVYEDCSKLYIIQDLCTGGELYKKVRQASEKARILTENYVKQMSEQILRALCYIHEHNIVHKDLKPENILFTNKNIHSEIKIIDFGLSEMFEPSCQESTNAAGTILYMAPEVFSKQVTMKCDLWSLGCIIYFLLTGKPPFYGRTQAEVRYSILKTEPSYVYLRYLSAEAIDLLQKLFTKNYKLRPSAKDLLMHPWFRSIYQGPKNSISSQILKNLVSYASYSLLKTAIINLITHQLSFDSAQIKNIANTFRRLDVDAKGAISRETLTRELSRHNLYLWEINKIIHVMDIDSSGDISFTEFIAAAYNWTSKELSYLWTTFQKLDAEHSGSISADDLLCYLCGENNEKNKEISLALKEINSGDDSKISWEQFLDYMTNKTKKNS